MDNIGHCCTPYYPFILRPLVFSSKSKDSNSISQGTCIRDRYFTLIRKRCLLFVQSNLYVFPFSLSFLRETQLFTDNSVKRNLFAHFLPYFPNIQPGKGHFHTHYRHYKGLNAPFRGGFPCFSTFCVGLSFEIV